MVLGIPVVRYVLSAAGCPDRLHQILLLVRDGTHCSYEEAFVITPILDARRCLISEITGAVYYEG